MVLHVTKYHLVYFEESSATLRVVSVMVSTLAVGFGVGRFSSIWGVCRWRQDVAEQRLYIWFVQLLVD
jgi:hypothetical protein